MTYLKRAFDLRASSFPGNFNRVHTGTDFTSADEEGDDFLPATSGAVYDVIHDITREGVA